MKRIYAFSCDGAKFAVALKRAKLVAASNREPRKYLQGACISAKPDGKEGAIVHVLGCDGHRLNVMPIASKGIAPTTSWDGKCAVYGDKIQTVIHKSDIDLVCMFAKKAERLDVTVWNDSDSEVHEKAQLNIRLYNSFSPTVRSLSLYPHCDHYCEWRQVVPSAPEREGYQDFDIDAEIAVALQKKEAGESMVTFSDGVRTAKYCVEYWIDMLRSMKIGTTAKTIKTAKLSLRGKGAAVVYAQGNEMTSLLMPISDAVVEQQEAA